MFIYGLQINTSVSKLYQMQGALLMITTMVVISNALTKSYCSCSKYCLVFLSVCEKKISPLFGVRGRI